LQSAASAAGVGVVLAAEAARSAIRAEIESLRAESRGAILASASASAWCIMRNSGSVAVAWARLKASSRARHTTEPVGADRNARPQLCNLVVREQASIQQQNCSLGNAAKELQLCSGGAKTNFLMP